MPPASAARRAAGSKAVLEFRKELFKDERDDRLNEVGKPHQRQDMLGHVTGRTRYFDDHAFEGLLHLKVLRSPHPHARIRAIDVSGAERAPGVKRLIRAADVPVNKNTLLSLIGFGKDIEKSLLEATSPFVFSTVNERSILRFLKLIACDNGKIGTYVKLVDDRNDTAHPNGNIFFSTQA